MKAHDEQPMLGNQFVTIKQDQLHESKDSKTNSPLSEKDEVKTAGFKMRRERRKLL